MPGLLRYRDLLASDDRHLPPGLDQSRPDGSSGGEKLLRGFQVIGDAQHFGGTFAQGGNGYESGVRRTEGGVSFHGKR